MKKIAIFGTSGMLGHAAVGYFSQKGYTVTSFSRSDYDIAKDDPKKLFELTKGMDLVLNGAGVIKPRIAHMSIEDVMVVNSRFPRNLAKACDKNGAKLFHITTDCVYTGDKGAYNEDDLYDATDLYGLSKNGGDMSDCMVLRTSIIGEEKDQARSLLEWAISQKGKQVNGFTNHQWNGVTTLCLVQVVEDIMTKGLYKKGIFHIHSPKSVSKLELVEIISDVYELNLNVKSAEAATFCDRTLSTKFELSSEVCKKQIQDQIVEMRAFFKGL
ncbi:MAG: sugar nucleotide-binding protein [Bacteriovoracaceae bacterium]|nr:sugar nucleotide-binding protein [Bacteriovoracaceae bacterium]